MLIFFFSGDHVENERGREMHRGKDYAWWDDTQTSNTSCRGRDQGDKRDTCC